ncbi:MULTISPECIES: DUF3540 domain-containing protein [Polyangium]|nr:MULTISPECIES: DUF3540 domain-containing protein [Polyangium]MDI1428237.1 DUF3540 domain-containing protein [Polyangium sorediatum]
MHIEPQRKRAKSPRGRAVQEVGTVHAIEGELIRVEVADDILLARRAASCLLAPAAGDAVLVVLLESGAAYVLAVLERDAEASSRIVLEGDASIEAPSGKVRVLSREGVEIVTEQEISLIAGRATIQAADTAVSAERLGVFSSAVHAEVGVVKVVAEALDSIADRIFQKAKRVYRVVTEQDNLRAESIDHAAKRTLSMRAEHAIVMAKELVKVDGEQIHLG